MKKQFKVYVACALTHVPKEQKTNFTLLLNSIKKELQEKGFKVMYFLSAIKEDPTPEEVYYYDIECLKNADCMLVLGDYPGTGLGYEICYTTELRKIPSMVGVTNLNNISKLLKGIKYNHYKLVIFNTSNELIESFTNFINKFYEKNN